MNIPFYTSKIQLHEDVIFDIFQQFRVDTKMLVFGLGYDSKMWFNANRATYFVEDKDEYIKLNQEIPRSNIIKYDYKYITVNNSFDFHEDAIASYKIPSELLRQAPYDIILIDGPEGWSPGKPGRLIPCYWSQLLSKKGTTIYIDDASRKLESYCIDKYYKTKVVKVFKEREQCAKVTY